MARGEQSFRVTINAWGRIPSILAQLSNLETTALAWVGGSRLEITPSAGRALMKKDVGAIKRIEKNMAVWLDVRYLPRSKCALMQSTLLRCIVGTLHNDEVFGWIEDTLFERFDAW